MAKSNKKTDKATRSKIVGVRLDPKLRHGLELVTRKQHRTISNYIEALVKHSLSKIETEDV
jgi:hypothetical protein